MAAAVQILHDLPDDQRTRAAEVYYDAFARKLGPLGFDRERGVPVLAEEFRADRAIVALEDGLLLGIAGLKYDDLQLADVHLAAMRRHFGWMGGSWRFGALALLMRPQPPGQLMMDGICVHPDARGKGVGTALLDAVFERARQLDLPRVRLDVVDTNPRARALYERRGFVTGKTSTYPGVHWLLGFGASTAMVREVEPKKGA